MLIKSGLITSASGSVGGMTASHNRGGMYLRARTIPVNPGSPEQTAVRSLLAQLTVLWGQTLSAAQRTAWEVYATNVTVLGPLGDPIQLTGLNHYIRSNVPRLQAGLARVDDGPTNFDLGDFTPPTLTTTFSTQLITVAFNVADPWVSATGAAMLVLASRTQNPSINYFKGPYRLAGSIDGDTALPPSSPQTIAAPFPMVTGNKTFVSVRVTQADGRLSTPFRVESVTVAI